MARSRSGRRLAVVALGIALAGLAALSYEVYTPGRIAFEPVLVQGLQAERAEGLVLQQEEPGVAWASRGYSFYRSEGGGPFEKVYTVVPRFGEAWVGYLRTLRRLFGYQELVELLPLRPDLLVVFAGGDVYRIDLTTGTQDRVHTLRYFGRGKGRGLMAHGLTRDGSGALYYGEYQTAPSEIALPIAIWRSDDEGRSWKIAFEFPPGAVRHVHSVQWDPVQGGVWVGTGDTDRESRVGFSLDQARTFQWIGEGSQEFRVCSLLFLPGTVLWGMDAEHSPSFAMRWLRGAQRAEAIPDGALPGPTFYAQAVDDSGGLIGLAEHAAELFWLRPEGAPIRLLQWTMPGRPRPGPHPGVRLARGRPSSPSSLLVNPLRTEEDEAAIYRIPRAALLGRVPAAPH